LDENNQKDDTSSRLDTGDAWPKSRKNRDNNADGEIECRAN